MREIDIRLTDLFQRICLSKEWYVLLLHLTVKEFYIFLLIIMLIIFQYFKNPN
jgi:hypothetical protein